VIVSLVKQELRERKVSSGRGRRAIQLCDACHRCFELPVRGPPGNIASPCGGQPRHGQKTQETDVISRRNSIKVMGAAALTATLAAPAVAQSGWPRQPIKLLVPFTAGSGSDNLARAMADELRQSLNVPVLVENKPGMGGQIGGDLIAKAPPDGYTVGISGASTNSAAPWLSKALSYDPVNDFNHIANIVTIPFMLVVEAGSPYKTVKDLVDAGKANPGSLTYGHGSASSNVTAAAFASLAGIKTLPVPYKGVPQAVTDLMGGQVKFVWVDVSVAGPQVKGGKVRALAVTGNARLTEFPDVPTLAEAGVAGFDLVVWVGLAAPRGTPADIAQLLNTELQKMGRKPEFRRKLEAQGFDVRVSSYEQHQQFVRQQLAVWGRRIKEAGIQPE